MTMPKWTGSIPTDLMTGMKTGTRMTSAASASMKHPTTSRKTLIMSRIVSGLWEIPRFQLPSCCGTWARASTQPNSDDVMTSISTTAFWSAVSSRSRGRSRQRSSRWMNSPRLRAYAAATKAASVGVNAPESIPPKSRTGVSSDRAARRVRRAGYPDAGEGVSREAATPGEPGHHDHEGPRHQEPRHEAPQEEASDRGIGDDP